MGRQLKRLPKRYGAVWFLAGLFMGVLYGSQSRHQRGAAPLPPPYAPAAPLGMDYEAFTSSWGQVEIGVDLAGWGEGYHIIAPVLPETWIAEALTEEGREEGEQ